MHQLHFVRGAEFLWSARIAVQSLFIIRQKNATCAIYVGTDSRKKQSVLSVNHLITSYQLGRELKELEMRFQNYFLMHHR